MAKSYCIFTLYQEQQRVCVLCVKLLQESISTHYVNSKDIRISKSSTHNHNYLMGTITFKVHHITLTSPRNTLATIFKNILILFTFHDLCIFFFNAYSGISCMVIMREKRNIHLCKPNILFLLCKCYTLLSMTFRNCTQMFYD